MAVKLWPRSRGKFTLVGKENIRCWCPQMVSQKKLSLSLSIKCANDVHGHYYFGGDEEWQSVTYRFKIVLLEGYHRFERV